MIARQLIDGAKAVGATLSLEGDRVRCKGAAPDLLAKLRAHKAEIAALLRADALIDEALHAGVVFRLVDPGPRETAEGRPFKIVLRYPKETPRGFIDRLHAARNEIYAAFTSHQESTP